MGRSGIRPADVAALAVVIAVIELNVAVGGGAGAAPLSAEAYILGAVTALPVLLCRRWPLPALWVSFALAIIFYTIDRRNISPAPAMAFPVYSAALAGYLAWAIGLPMLLMTTGLIVVGVLGRENTVVMLANFLPSFALFILAVALGEVVRGRRALAAETERRLRIAADERRSQEARLLAEERLRIARELHDTVAHSMATIAVQAGSALHLLSASATDAGADAGAGDGDGAEADVNEKKLHDSLLAIRETSKGALGDMRTVLGRLRGDESQPAAPADGLLPAAQQPRAIGLSRLPGLRTAVTAAGSPVTVTVEGDEVVLPPAADHAAYRILQESLTNVLRHAPPGTAAAVRLSYGPGALTITVENEGGPGAPRPAGSAPGPAGSASGPAGSAPGPAGSAGNGILGMRERAVSIGGSVEAGPRPDGGFAVSAVIPDEVPRS